MQRFKIGDKVKIRLSRARIIIEESDDEIITCNTLRHDVGDVNFIKERITKFTVPRCALSQYSNGNVNTEMIKGKIVQFFRKVYADDDVLVKSSTYDATSLSYFAKISVNTFYVYLPTSILILDDEG